jgi:hypothetical protein
VVLILTELAILCITVVFFFEGTVIFIQRGLPLVAWTNSTVFEEVQEELILRDARRISIAVHQNI